MWYKRNAKVVEVAVAVSAICLVTLLAFGGCTETGAGGGGSGGGGGGGAPPQTYEETLSDGTNVAVLSPVSVTLTEAAPGSYPDGAAGPVVDIDGNLGPGETATVTFTKDPGESPFPAGTSILHNDGGPYWSVEQTDTSVDRMSISATLSDFSFGGSGVPVADVEVTFDEIAAFREEELDVTYTVSPPDATETAVNVWWSGAAEATDLDDDDGKIELEFNGEGYGEVIIQSQYEPAITSFSVLSIREIDLTIPPSPPATVTCTLQPDPLEPGENYYYVDGLTVGELYVANLDLPPGLDREVVAAIATVDNATETVLTADRYVHDADEPLINYYITSRNDVAPLVFRADEEYQFFVVTDGSEASNLDFDFNLSVTEYTAPVGDYLLRIETYEPSDTSDETDTSMAIFDANVDIAAGAFDVSDTNKFSRLIVDTRTLLGCIIAVAAQREFRDPAYIPQTGGYAIMITNDTSDTTIAINAESYPEETTYEVMDSWLVNGTGLCVQICDDPACGLGNPGTRFLDPGDMDLTELEADFMWFDP